MRTAFIQQLITEARQNPNVFLLVGDLGFSVVEPFVNEFPNQYLNVGIAEQNMTSVACGLAMEGYKVFTYSIGNFPTLRCMEQIRNDVCYHNLDVKIIAVGGGYAYAALGISHHATEELGMLRTLPNLLVAAPGDPSETEQITHLLAHTQGPAYMRLGKAGEPKVHTQAMEIELGSIIETKKGNEVAVLSTGAMLYQALQEINQFHPHWGLYSCPFLSHTHVDMLLDISRYYEQIITLEEHQRNAGFGSFILEQYADLAEKGIISQMPRIKRIAIPNTFANVAGTQNFLREKMGLSLK